MINKQIDILSSYIMHVERSSIIPGRQNSVQPKRYCIPSFCRSNQRNPGLERITAATKDLVNVEFNLAGRIRDKELLDQLQELPNVKYKRLMQYS